MNMNEYIYIFYIKDKIDIKNVALRCCLVSFSKLDDENYFDRLD